MLDGHLIQSVNFSYCEVLAMVTPPGQQSYPHARSKAVRTVLALNVALT